ncbi:restriction endonuclease [Candidatus Woesearchaeota archaeon]|nr:restriction endonuclease [Candidatus Woesearchaeota archaeon]
MLEKSKMSKEEKRKLILDYIRSVYQKEKRLVSKREIREVFHVELYNYFRNLFDMYQKINVEVPLCFCPKEYAVRRIIDFVREKSLKGLYPTIKEIEKELKIHIRSYFKGLKWIYKKADIDYSLYLKRRYTLEHACYSDKLNLEKKNQIIKYVQEKQKNGIYPSRIEIQLELKLKFDNYFPNVKEAYKAARVKYNRPCPIILGKNKEKVLTQIVSILLKRMNYKILRVSIYDKEYPNRYEDIKVVDRDGNVLLIELKAYKADYNISKREIEQLLSYLKQQSISDGLFITTTKKVNLNTKNIKIINGIELISLLRKYNLEEYIEKIKWIQSAKVDLKERILRKMDIKNNIIGFIRHYNGIPFRYEIEKEFHIDIRTYFPGLKDCNKLIKKIKFNICSSRVCKDRQLTLQCI